MRYDEVAEAFEDSFNWTQCQLSLLDSHREFKEGNTNMGMFDKDKVFAPDGQLNDSDGGGFANMGDEFVLWDCEVKTEEFEFDPTEDAIPMAHLTVSKKISPDEKKVVSTLSGPICEKVREKEDGDLPAVVRLQSVPAKKKEFNDAVVLQFIEPFQLKK
jgi:hypothetical protein